MRSRGLLFLFALCVCPQLASARPNVSVEFGPASALPTGKGEDRMGGQLRLGVANELSGGHRVGGRIQVGVFNNDQERDAQDAWTLLGFYRYELSESDALIPFAGAALGGGYWNGCVNGDLCGGIGVTAGVEVGTFLRLSENMLFTISAELVSIFNLPNRVGNMLMPAIHAGIYF